MLFSYSKIPENNSKKIKGDLIDQNDIWLNRKRKRFTVVHYIECFINIIRISVLCQLLPKCSSSAIIYLIIILKYINGCAKCSMKYPNQFKTVCKKY